MNSISIAEKSLIANIKLGMGVYGNDDTIE
jgi:hypothetical protein